MFTDHSAHHCLQHFLIINREFYIIFPDIVKLVQSHESPPFRPKLPSDGCDKKWMNLMEMCWHEDAEVRPTFEKVKPMLKDINGGK